MKARALSRLAALLVLGLAWPARAQLDPAFPVPVWPTLGTGNKDALLADLNLDGRLDAVMLAQILGVDSVTVALALPGGGFGPVTSTGVATASRDVAVGLLEADSWPDVVSFSVSANNVAVLRGTGGGALAAPVLYPTGGTLRCVALGDVNGDGLADIATGSGPTQAALQVNRANGAGGFLATLASPLAVGLQPIRLELADLDGDGELDAVCSAQKTNLPATLLVAHGDGAGGFATTTTQSLAKLPVSLLVRDLDADGDLDALAGCEVLDGQPGVLALLRGDGAGGLLPAETLATPTSATSADAADLDGDGVLDLVAGGGTLRRLWTLRGNGAGGWAAPQEVEAAQDPTLVFAADVTDDGVLDVLSWQAASHTLAALVGDGAGGLLGARRLLMDAPASVSILDIDRDGFPDLVTVGGDSGNVARFLADGRGGFLPPKFTPTSTLGFDGTHLEPGDLDGDGDQDVVVTTSKTMVVLKNDGAGGLLPATAVTGAPEGSDVALVDLDGDGDLDALEIDNPPAGPGTMVVRFLGDGHAHLLSPQSWVTGTFTFRMDTGDLDGDGDADAVTANLTSQDLAILRGDGAGGFAAAVSVPATMQVADVKLGDLDLDGALDAAAAQFGGGFVRFHGDGAGGLQLVEAQPALLAGGTVGVAIADLDGDGWRDVLVSDPKAAFFSVRRNDGAGGLLAPVGYVAGDYAAALAVGDLDGDGKPEVVVCNQAYPQKQGTLSISANLAASFTWTDLGHALAGSFGEPELVGTGALTPGSPGALHLFRARPLSLAVILVSSGSTPAPFKGGVLVPVPPELMLTVVTDGIGAVSLGWLSWPSSAPGADWFFQVAVPDAEAVHGVALSNALKAVEP